MMKGDSGKNIPAIGSGMDPVPRTWKWHQSNCALARLLSRHQRVLNKATAVALEIRREIDELTPLMTELCRRTCRFCPEPCCITNTVWIDFRDLLFFHLTDEPIPPCQAASDSGDACPFLSHRGCRLPRRIRPWMCIKYICPAQRAVLQKKERPVSAALCADIQKIERNRLRMEVEVIRRIRRKIRTSPSSSSACSG
jgi:hypothetical protein